MKKIILLCFLLGYFFSSSQTISQKHEFRGVWVATVANIDWPSKPGLSTGQQQQEIIEILDMHQKLKMNAVIVQIRPAADAFYPSELEPWSRYLTGVPGQAPEPFYDPLAFWVEESHKRGMEFHAWLNPFRVAQDYTEPLAGNHIAFEHPEWVLKYGNKLYFDPGLPETRKFVAKVVKDIVTRYDVDAIHFDDYFYPYPLAEDFPDTTSFNYYSRGFMPEKKADWRRENVDIIIEMLNDTIKATKPWVKFGISPFGVWRNKADDPLGSDTKAGATNYDHLYADVLKWQKMGWIDYLLPQLYWQIGHPAVDFEMLTNWWKNHVYHRHMYIGHGVYKSDPNSSTIEWALPEQLPRQINLLRKTSGISGSAFYSSKHFKRDLMGFQDSLVYNLYKYPTIVPPMEWIDDIPPRAVQSLKQRGKKVKWETIETDAELNKPNRFIIYLTEKGTPFDPDNVSFIYKITKETKHKFERINRKRKKYEVRFSVLDRLNNESMFSKPVVVKI
ncbi:MAG TPA: family 10 glycosylhydrolase [Prolixibacteraceae bacterium]|nr:family 10 glycosylhydrolase [Prolixibacteraceae bacterium]